MKTAIGTAFRFCLRAGLFFVSFSLLLVLVLKWLPVSWTPLMFVRVAQHIGDGKAKIEHDWVSADHIANSLQLAVVCTEDQHFLVHHGFDFEQIQVAMDEAEKGGRVRGASTISQQTAKNVFLWPSSSFLRKGFEVWFTALIELLWGKQRIMEVYLNSIEFGDGIYGCEAASKHFYHKSALYLSPAESARLAIVLPNPIRFNVGKPSGYMMRRQSWALTQMGYWGGTLKYSDKKDQTENAEKNNSRSGRQPKTSP